jgi:hypothetical protein
MFVVHRIGDRCCSRSRARELGKDQLAVGRYARAAAPTGGPGGGFGSYGGDRFVTRTLRWERDGNRIILRTPSYSIIADSDSAIYAAVQSTNYPPIIAVFNIEAFGPDSAAVIDVTRLFTTAIPELQAIRAPSTRALLHRACAGVPGQHRDRGDADGQQPAPAGRRRRRRRVRVRR